ncbi:NAD(P)H-dependent oxidoreductase [Pedobacter sp. SYP-B3415]|uniref:NAD(P)H-dependent oxidoreductase n=1 Tax=Pedobacter sp. SYP-B3415 TaxID=2496641 RepID=UPI00101C4E4D|nr:NAD(P)H-dependent oxidoreductase [Pedobacter sp. SYP-B3415]
MKHERILIINGHPDPQSFNEAIANAYTDALEAHNVEFRYLPLHRLNFDPNLRYGFRDTLQPEPDLLAAIDDLKWCSHLVWIHPIWWYGFPALMKGFIDRAFLPGITFHLNADGSVSGHLEGRSARIIATGDTPQNLYTETYAESARIQLQNGVLAYCGVSPIAYTYLHPVYASTPEIRQEWLDQVKQLALDDAGLGAG